MTVKNELEAAGMTVLPALKASESFVQVLKQMGYSFAFNLAAMDLEVNGSAVTDIIEAKIRRDVRDKGIKTIAAVEDAWKVACSENSYHPVQDYFKALKWDGVDHIAELCSKLQSDSPDVIYADGSAAPIASVYITKWLIGAVAKVFRGTQNPMLVFDAVQGLGKSLLSAFFSPKRQWFIEAAINTNDKDCDIRLMSKFIWEVSELDATTRKADISALKAFLTKAQVTVRKSYGRNDVVGQAMCSFIGTINNSVGFLADETGNRRFWVIHLTGIDWSYTKLDIDQIWAQAYHLWSLGVEHTLTPEEIAIHGIVNEGYEIETPLENWVLQYFVITAEPDDIMSMGEIINHLTEKEIRIGGNEKMQAMELAKVLSAHGCKRTTRRHHGKLQKVWQGIYPVGV